MAEKKTFGQYLNVGKLANNDVNKFLIQTLYSQENLNNSLSVGFKGNPNVGTVVLNEMISGADWYDAFRRHCEKGDRIFIISSIFGGTGASGYPLLEKKIRDDQAHPQVQNAVMGAVTVLPYYSLDDPTTSGSDIDSSNFYTKTKAALSYYEKSVKSDYLYYVGEQSLRANYKNNEKEQKDKAHLVELVAASALYDFLSRPAPDTPQAMTRAIRENADALDMSSLGEGYKPMVKDIANMMIFDLLLDIFLILHHSIEHLLGILLRDLLLALLLLLLLLLILLFLILLLLLLVLLLLLLLLLFLLFLLLLVLLFLVLLLLLLLLLQHVHSLGQVVSCLVVAGVVAQRLLVCFHALLILLRHVEQRTQVVVYVRQLRLVGLERSRRSVLLHRLLRPLLSLLFRLGYLIEQRIAQVVCRIHRLRIQLQCLAILHLGLLVQAIGIEPVTSAYMVTLRHRLRSHRQAAAEQHYV